MKHSIPTITAPHTALAESSTASTRKAGRSRPMPHSVAQDALSSRSRPLHEAGQSPIETLPPEVLHTITGLLPAQAAAATLATSRAMNKAARESPLAGWNLEHRTPAEPCRAEFRRALKSLNDKVPRDLHEKPLTSLGMLINGMPEMERQHAAGEFVKSVDEFAQHLTKHRLKLADDASPLMELYRAAKLGPQGLANRDEAVMKKHAVPLVDGGASVTEVLQQLGISEARIIHELKSHAVSTRGKAAMDAGENAQEVARRLGVDSMELEKMTARAGSPHRPCGPAYRAVTESGDKLQDVFTKFGIRDYELKIHLAEACVHGLAGQEVRAGMSPEDAARKYGLDQIPYMRSKLKRIAEARNAAGHRHLGHGHKDHGPGNIDGFARTLDNMARDLRSVLPGDNRPRPA